MRKQKFRINIDKHSTRRYYPSMSLDFKLNTPKRLASSLSQTELHALSLKLETLYSGRRGGRINGINCTLCSCCQAEYQGEEES